MKKTTMSSRFFSVLLVIFGICLLFLIPFFSTGLPLVYTPLTPTATMITTPIEQEIGIWFIYPRNNGNFDPTLGITGKSQNLTEGSYLLVVLHRKDDPDFYLVDNKKSILAADGDWYVDPTIQFPHENFDLIVFLLDEATQMNLQKLLSEQIDKSAIPFDKWPADAKEYDRITVTVK